MDQTVLKLTKIDKLPFILLALLCAVCLVFEAYIPAAIAGAALIISVAAALIQRRKKRLELRSFIEDVSYEAESAKSSTLMSFPLPIAVFRLEDSRIVWGNDLFFEMCGETGTRLDASLAELVPHFSGKWLLEGKRRYPTLLEVGGRKYQLHGNVIPSEVAHGSAFMGITYWVDVTEYDDMRIKFENTRPVVGVVSVDNLDELGKNQPDRIKNDIRDAIEEKLSGWCAKFGGIIRRIERDRYLLILERQNVELLKIGKFAITNEMHQVVSPSGFTASISIGLGVDGESFYEAFQFGLTACELALSRGGDQTVIKNRMGFEFYGGRGSEVEKRTKVKSRVIANAFAELVKSSQRMLIVGHKFGDLDSVGACVGVYSIARQLGVKAWIVLDPVKNNAKELVELMKREPEYREVFISPAEAAFKADAGTLLCAVDTSRPEQLDAPDLLRLCGRVTVIDHHRVGATYITEPALEFIEPYASSACELVAEIIQEIPETEAPLRCEAEALLSGIVLDTKSFTLRTGERTFDAASYLRRSGADMYSVKRLLQSGMEDTVKKYKILQSAELYRSIAVAVPEDRQDRVVAAKAADELLNITGVDASIVIAYGEDGNVFASARSIGELNVQLIMEKLGGGGNRSAAAVQFKDEDLESAVQQVYAAIDDYLS